MTCVSCFEECTVKLKRPIECPKCKTISCYTCTSKYFKERINQFVELVCMNPTCDLIYDRELFYNLLGKHWVSKYFTNYCKMMLFQKQKAKFEETLM